MKESCQRKASLMREWQEAATIYSKAIGNLTEKMGKFSEVEYERMKRKAEIARKLARQLRAELDVHISAHGC
jgi:hypothetical protein